MHGRRLLVCAMAAMASVHTSFAEEIAHHDVPHVKGTAITSEDQCPPCDLLFTELESTPGGKRSQNVEVMERGEPKSGTGFMFEWAGSALVHACDYLKKVFGESSCITEHIVDQDRRFMNMTFEPSEAGVQAPCSCSGISRASVVINSRNKHRLPTSFDCAVVHAQGIPSEGVCTFKDGRKPINYHELWLCTQEAACQINDYRRQMVVFRDPRPLVVSAYFYLLVRDQVSGTVDEYVAAMLTTYCQWVAVRYIIFEGRMRDQSTLFWYDEALAHPLKWHHQFLHFVGLNLPDSTIEAATDAAMTRSFTFRAKGVDPHPGGQEKSPARSYEDEITPESLAHMDSVLRLWLPPPLLVQFGVPPDPYN